VTVQLERSDPRGPAPEDDLRSPIASGMAAALWAVAVGLAVVAVPVILAWLFAPHAATDPGDALRAGALAWLAAQHASVDVGGAVLSLVPLGLLAVPAVLLYRCGRWAGRVAVDALPAALATLTALVATYATVAAVLSSLVGSSESRVDPVSGLLGAGGLALLAGGAGVIVGADLREELLDHLPESVVEVLRSALIGLAVMLGGGALLLVSTMLWHGGRIASLYGSLHPGVFGGLVLLVLGLLYLPTAVVWASSYAVGPGFAVGLGTTVAPAGVALGPVPAFPLLGALPGTGPAPVASLVALLTPVLAGVLVGAVVVRRATLSPGRLAGRAAAAGALAGALLGIVALLSSGSVGAVRMSDLGPGALQVGAVAALEVATVAAAVAWEGSRHRARLGAASRWVMARVPGSKKAAPVRQPGS